MIESGRLKEGEALPSTREMAGQWSVSVFTINEMNGREGRSRASPDPNVSSALVTNSAGKRLALSDPK
jgi:DNA-binding transcriptional MocR family regulator